MIHDVIRANPIGRNITSIDFLVYTSEPVVFWVKPVIEDENDYFYFLDPYQSRSTSEKYDTLKYRMMNDNVPDEMFEILRDSYLERIGRRLLDFKNNSGDYCFEPQTQSDID